MKKLMLISLITLSVAVALVLTAGILRSITFDTATFNPTPLANAFFTIGYLVAALSGVVLAGAVIANVVKGGDTKKAILFSAIIVAVGITLVLVAAVLGTIPATTWGTGVGTFNPAAANALNAALNTIGYLTAVLAGVILVALTVARVVKNEASSK